MWIVIGFAIVDYGSMDYKGTSYYTYRTFENPSPVDEVRSRYWYAYYYILYKVFSVGSDTEIAASSFRRLWKLFSKFMLTLLIGSVWPIHLIVLKFVG